MSRRPCTFRQSDLTRALKAARAAGVKVRIEIEPGGKLIVVSMDESEGNSVRVDDEVERWLGKHANQS
jgi:hypothetical protein